jgi:hypothetical protein
MDMIVDRIDNCGADQSSLAFRRLEDQRRRIALRPRPQSIACTRWIRPFENLKIAKMQVSVTRRANTSTFIESQLSDHLSDCQIPE